jgi:carbon starvation protein
VAIAIGWLIYKRQTPALVPSLVALALLYFFVWVGTVYPVDVTTWGLTPAAANKAWIVFLFAYSAIASLLPVWLLLQPRDFINSHQLIVGLGLLFAGLFVAHPDLDAPALRTSEDGAPSLFPLLFVTIACGAISGFHGLVSSGTTSKQISELRHARMIGYGGMLGEGTLALASTMAAVAGIGLVAACNLPGQGAVPDLSWAVYYDSWAHAGANKASAFVLGGAAFLGEIGIPADVARTLMAVLVISFAATTLDTATRIQRFIVAELGGATGLPILENRYVATAIAVVPAVLLTLWEVSDPATGRSTQAGWVLWPIFGASNQMLAALTLMVLALYFWSRKRPVLPIVLPMLFAMVVTFLAMSATLMDFVAHGNLPMAGFAAVLLGLNVWMLVEGAAAVWRKTRASSRV